MTIEAMVREMVNEAGRPYSEAEKILRKKFLAAFVEQVHQTYFVKSIKDPNNKKKYADEGVTQLLGASASIINKLWR